jgi:hypothetical protein
MSTPPGHRNFHMQLPREQHRRLELVATVLSVSMGQVVRDVVVDHIDRQFVALGLDRVPIPGRADPKHPAPRRRPPPRKAS